MFNTLHRTAIASLIALAVAGLSGCGTRMLSAVDAHGMTDKPVFPAAQDANRPEGSYVNLENLSKIAPGMTKTQVRELLGAPHFAEGMFDVREWDYLLHVPASAGAAGKTCQYKVLFDDQLQARSFFAQPAGCLDGLAQISEPQHHQQAQAAAY